MNAGNTATLVTALVLFGVGLALAVPVSIGAVSPNALPANFPARASLVAVDPALIAAAVISIVIGIGLLFTLNRSKRIVVGTGVASLVLGGLVLVPMAYAYCPPTPIDSPLLPRGTGALVTGLAGVAAGLALVVAGVVMQPRPYTYSQYGTLSRFGSSSEYSNLGLSTGGSKAGYGEIPGE